MVPLRRSSKPCQVMSTGGTPQVLIAKGYLSSEVFNAAGVDVIEQCVDRCISS
jgi:hypothetical protein